MLRKTVYGLLTSQPDLTAVVPANRWWSRGATLDTPQTPYVVLAWLGNLTTSGRTTPQLLDVYVHDEIGDYVRIEELLGGPEAEGGVYAALSVVQQYRFPSVSGRLVQADYLGRSADLTDPETKTGFMYSSWKLLGGK